jgi:hypothetical protein
MDQVVADLRPPWLTAKCRCGGPCRRRAAEDGDVGAALALEFELRALDARADFVVGHLEGRPREQRPWVRRLGLVLAEAMQVFGSVV